MCSPNQIWDRNIYAIYGEEEILSSLWKKIHKKDKMRKGEGTKYISFDTFKVHFWNGKWQFNKSKMALNFIFSLHLLPLSTF